MRKSQEEHKEEQVRYNTVWSIGDSFTYGLCMDESLKDQDNPFRVIEYSFAESLKDQIESNMSVERYGYPGCTNTDIVSMVMKHYPKMRRGDVAILMYTTPERTLLPFDRVVEGTQKPLLKEFTESDLFHPTLKGITGPEMLSLNNNDWRLHIEGTWEGWPVSNIENALKNYFTYVIAPKWNNYNRYYENFMNLTVNLLKHKGVGTVVLHNRLWEEFSVDVKKEKYEDAGYLYESGTCECGHWNELGHHLIGKAAYESLVDGNVWIDENNLLYYLDKAYERGTIDNPNF